MFVMRYVKRISGFLFVLMVIGIFGVQVQAQETSESDFEAFQEQLQRDYFTVGALLQAVGDYQYERSSGYSGFLVGGARLQVKGLLDNKFGYQLQTNFLNNFSVLDANVYYNITPDFSMKAGLFKAPFSLEYLTGAAAIDFVNRSSVVNRLAPKRQIGAQLQGKIADGKLKYSAGMFNGNGYGNNQNDDGNFLYSARLEANSGWGNAADNNIMVGINAAYEENDQPSGGNVLSQVSGEQVLLGADTRINHDKLMLAGEFIYANLDTDLGAEHHPFGYYLTAGYFVTPKTQLLVRWDYFDGDFYVDSSDSIIGGVNIFLTEFSQIKFNYSYPVEEGIDYSQLLMNLQIAF